MNGQGSGAFRKALTDAVLEEYSEMHAVPKASKRGIGNRLGRAVRYAVLAAVLMSVMLTSVLASTDLTGVRYPAEEVKKIHYEWEDRDVLPKSEIEMVYCPKNIPFRMKKRDVWVSKEVVNIYWVDDNDGDHLFFTSSL